MQQVLVTGATGVLGRQLVPRLARAGYAVRVMSRRSAWPNNDPRVEWIQVDLETGKGLERAVAGVDVIVHAATSVSRRSKATDVNGTARLLKSARDAGASHLLYPSIVGTDQIPLSYYRYKREAEALVQRADVPWSILRVTQFHSFVDEMLQWLAWIPIGLLPTDFQFQPIDPGEVADCVVTGPTGRVAGLGGPEVRSLGELAQTWLEIRGLRRPLIRLPMPGKVAAGFRLGLNTLPHGRSGRVTWVDWVRRKYGHPSQPH